MSFLDPKHEPVRRWAYGTATAVIASAVIFGLVTGEQGAAIGAVLAALLLVPVAEVQRSKVYAPDTVARLESDLAPVGDSDREALQ